MKLLCLSNMSGLIGDQYINIIPGKYYECEPYGSLYYLVLDESGQKCLYMTLNFENLEVTRDNKLNDLGI